MFFYKKSENYFKLKCMVWSLEWAQFKELQGQSTKRKRKDKKAKLFYFTCSSLVSTSYYCVTRRELFKQHLYQRQTYNTLQCRFSIFATQWYISVGQRSPQHNTTLILCKCHIKPSGIEGQKTKQGSRTAFKRNLMIGSLNAVTESLIFYFLFLAGWGGKAHSSVETLFLYYCTLHQYELLSTCSFFHWIFTVRCTFYCPLMNPGISSETTPKDKDQADGWIPRG